MAQTASPIYKLQKTGVSGESNEDIHLLNI